MSPIWPDWDGLMKTENLRVLAGECADCFFAYCEKNKIVPVHSREEFMKNATDWLEKRFKDIEYFGPKGG